VSRTLISTTIVEDMALPRLVWLRPNLVGMAFPILKLLPAQYILRKALEDGVLAPGGAVAETSSGTFGLALAMVAGLQGHPLSLISDPTLEPGFRRRLEDLGATVHVVTDPGPSGAWQRARLEYLDALLEENPGTFCPRQYDNPQNPASYAPCAEQLAHAAGAVDCLVGPVGSGGSLFGIASYLRLLFPELGVIAVDAQRSVIFGQPDARRVLKGIGNSIVPGNVDHAAVDMVQWVSAPEAFLATRQLHRQHGMFMGPTSGAAFLAADWWARENPDSLTAVILPDEGWRYLDTVYNDEWLAERGLKLDALPQGPAEWDRPHDGADPWSFYRWGRRTLPDVMGARPTVLELVS
jgi:cysteine synthase